MTSSRIVSCCAAMSSSHAEVFARGAVRAPREDLGADGEEPLALPAAARPQLGLDDLAVSRRLQLLGARGEPGEVVRMNPGRERLDAARRELLVGATERAGEGGVVRGEPHLGHVDDAQDRQRRVDEPRERAHDLPPGEPEEQDGGHRADEPRVFEDIAARRGERGVLGGEGEDEDERPEAPPVVAHDRAGDA